jgi:hypothetical protein
MSRGVTAPCSSDIASAVAERTKRLRISTRPIAAGVNKAAVKARR